MAIEVIALPRRSTPRDHATPSLGLDAPEEALAKAELTAKISEIVEARGLTQAAAAKVLSTERLIKFLNALGQDVEIVVKDRRRGRGPGHLQVVLI